jgi:hypothetical protein
MSLVIEKFILCDFCGESYGVDDRSACSAVRTIRSDAKRNGWIFYGGRDYCPSCAVDRGHKGVNDDIGHSI